VSTSGRDWRWGPYGSVSGWARAIGIAVAAGVFLAFAGAFGSGDAPAPQRYLYWILLMVVGALWGGFLARLFFPAGERGGLWLRVGALSLLLAASLTGLVAVAGRLLLGAPFGLGDVPVLFGAVFAVSAVMTSVNVLIGRRAAAAEAARAAAAPAPPTFLERLPLKLRGAELWAVEAEDHYLRLHTSKGQDLILMRLADAIAELEGVEGMQVHRSWWVAREAIVDARRGDGRATLKLRDGAEVPVSRTYAGMLRQRGWI
jgi:hypothetical protein